MKAPNQSLCIILIILLANSFTVNASNNYTQSYSSNLLMQANLENQKNCFYSASEIFQQIYVQDFKKLKIDQQITLLKNYAQICIQLNNYAKASDLYNQILNIVLKYNGLNSNEAIDIQSNIAYLKAKLTRLNKTYSFRRKDLQNQNIYTNAVKQKEEALKLNPIDKQDIIDLFNKTNDCLKINNYGQAKIYADQALALIEQNYGSNSLAFSFGLVNLANIYNNEGKFRLSENFYQQILNIDNSLNTINPLIKAEHLRNYGWINYFLHQFSESLELLKESITLKESVLSPDSFVLMMSITDLAKLYSLEQDYEKADALYREAIKMCDKNPAAQSSKPLLLNNYANLLLEMGRYSEADDALAKAYQLENKSKTKLK